MESFVSNRRNSAGWMPENIGRWSVGVGRRYARGDSDYAQGVIQDTVYEACVSAATPDDARF